MAHMGLMAGVALVAGCGRFGFDPQRDAAPNGVPDAGPYREPEGRLDPTFGTGGQTVLTVAATSEVYDVLLRPGGYLVGGFISLPAATRLVVIGLTDGGALDVGYGTDGYSLHAISNADFGYGLVDRPDGTTLLVGDGAITGPDDFVFVAVNDGGLRAPSFSGDGILTRDSAAAANDTTSSAVQIGELTYACGTIRYDLTTSEAAILAFDLAGDFETAFDTDGVVFDPLGGTQARCEDIVADRSGRIVIAGGSAGSAAIVRYLPTGARDASFGVGGIARGRMDTRAFALALAANDDLIAGGNGASDGMLMRVTASGAPAVFGVNGIATLPAMGVSDVALQPDGKITAIKQQPDGAIIAVGYVRPAQDMQPWIARIE